MTIPLHTEYRWIPADTTLYGTAICLRPLQPEHFDDLIEMGRDPRIWANFPSDRSDPEVHRRQLETMYVEMQAGQMHAFAIEKTDTGEIAGLTRLFHLNPRHHHCEIGTWLGTDHWHSGINTESKFLLMAYCFEQLDMMRIQFRTDAENQRSRSALEKLGAQFEGIIRKERIRDNGQTRDAAIYSILDEEWSFVRERLLERMHRAKRPHAARNHEIETSASDSLALQGGENGEHY